MPPDARLRELLAVLDGIVDPCSAAARVPAGLVEMGIVERAHEADGHVEVILLPTFAGCLHVALFAAEIERRVGALAWCRSVRVRTTADELWTEARMSPALRRRLAERRDAARR
jgi:metal-sulfur cluster biosynthetic enzyme